MRCPACGAENEDDAEVCFHCRALLGAVTRGAVLGGRYEILSPLGRGGMGAVYRARDRVLEEDVALKVLRRDVAGTEERARRFRSEVQLARRVSHWNVCRIHEYGEDGPLRFITMELVEGETLKDALRREGCLPPARAFDVSLQVAQGLAAIHQAGVVHRDLKSANIMLDGSGRVRVMDFGIAKPEAAPGAAQSGYVVGSPEYMSPEQARGLPVDARSDLYALGVVVHELFTGDVPFRADTPVRTLLLHLEKAPALDAPSLPEGLRPVLRRALAKDPAARYASAREVEEALREARGDPPARGSTAPLPSPPRRRAFPWAGVGVLAAVVAAALLAGRRPRDPSESVAPTRPPAPETTLAPSPSIPTATPAPGSPPPVAAAVPHPRPARESAGSSAPAPSKAPPTAPTPSSTPTPLPTPTPSPPPTPAAAPATTPTAALTPAPDGALLVLVTPWADVNVDGEPRGQTPLARIPLAPGPHDVRLSHPDYAPFPRRVVIRSGETFRLVVDLPTEGVRRPR
jgi:serine/threonine-protein kinase